MGRKEDTLKPFIDEHIKKGYINFNKNEEGVFELCTPRKKKKLGIDPNYEKIFKAYEHYRGRKYGGYKVRDTFKQAIRKSKLYEVFPSEQKTEKMFRFRERTLQEIDYLQMIKEIKDMVVTSPEMGYETGDNSSNPSPNPSESNDSTMDVPQLNNYINFEDVDMEEKTDEIIQNDSRIQELCLEASRKFIPSDCQNYQDENGKNDYVQDVSAAHLVVASPDTNPGLQVVHEKNNYAQNIGTANLTALAVDSNYDLQGAYEKNNCSQNISVANLTALPVNCNYDVQGEAVNNDSTQNVSAPYLTVLSVDNNSGLQGEAVKHDYTQNVSAPAPYLTVLSVDNNSGPQDASVIPEWKSATLYQIPGHFVRFIQKPNTYSLNELGSLYVLQPLMQ